MSKLSLKEKKVKEIETVLNESEAVVVASYLGTDANSINALRKSLHGAGSRAEVYKNTFVRRGLDSAKIDYADDLIKGGNMFVNTTEDIVGMAKALVAFQGDSESFEIKGAFLNKKFISQQEVKNLSELPSKDELVAMALQRLKSPISGLVRTLSSPVNGLICVLNNIKDKK